MPRYLFDTNALNALFDYGVKSTNIADGIHCCVTAAQISELKATRRDERRLELLQHFETLAEDLPLSSASLRSGPFGTSPFGQTPFGGGDGKYYGNLKRELDKRPGNRSRRGNTTDALTLEVCIYEKTILVTNDSSLSDIAQSHGVPVISFEKFITLKGTGLLNIT